MYTMSRIPAMPATTTGCVTSPSASPSSFTTMPSFCSPHRDRYSPSPMGMAFFTLNGQ